MALIGFLINPVAGMGGRVGLKGTDGVADEARSLGAVPVAPVRARQALRRLKELCRNSVDLNEPRWLTCSGSMGADALNETGFEDNEVVHNAGTEPTGNDTAAAVRAFQDRGVDLILFCGGDGTARDICAVAAAETLILGIPSGVKMYSGVFGINPARTAEILFDFLKGILESAEVEVLDLDEEKYRHGEWAVRLFHSARTPFEPSRTQSAKMLIAGVSDAEVKEDIAKYVIEYAADETNSLLLLGAGSTVAAVGERLGIDKTLLGVDAVAGGKLIGKDLNERQILDLLSRFDQCRLVLSPIGAQGFVLGRGNLQLSPEVVRRIGPKNLIVISTPAKLARTPILRFDTGDAALDLELFDQGYIPVVVGYGLKKTVKLAI